MNTARPKLPKIKPTPAAPAPTTPVANNPPPESPGPPHPPPLYRRIDWLTFGVTVCFVLVAYLMTLAPNLTLEDSGELAVGSFYAGVPHPPGYPVWTIYSWLFTVLLPISNIAFRVAVSSAVSAALACGLLALMVSRGSSMIIEGIAELKGIEPWWENALCIVSGFVAGCLLAFNGFYWSQAIIVEVYCFSVLSLMGVLCCLLRWLYAPHQLRYLYVASFLFGICFTNHQTLLVGAMGLEIAVMAVSPRLGRDLVGFNSVVYLLGLLAKSKGVLTTFDNNTPLFVIYNVIGIGSLVGFVWLTLTTRKTVADWQALLRDVLLVIGVAYLLIVFGMACGLVTRLDTGDNRYVLLHLVGLGSLAGTGWLTWKTQRKDAARLIRLRHVALGVSALYLVCVIVTASGSPGGMFSQPLNRNLTIFVLHHLIGWAALVALAYLTLHTSKLANDLQALVLTALIWVLGATFYLYMPITSATNPPMNWGYPRTYDGFIHALTRGQYERTNPINTFSKLESGLRVFTEGAVEEFNFVYLLVGLVPFIYFLRMQRREQSWFIGLWAIFVCLGFLLLMLLSPTTDKASKDLNKVFFTASYALIAMGVGYGLTLLGSYVALQYEKYRLWLLGGSALAAAIAIYSLAVTLASVSYPLKRYTGMFGVALAFVSVGAFLLARTKAPRYVLLGVFAFMPFYSILGHWSENEQHGHMFGFWFGHDMFTPPDFGQPGRFYPKMARDAILFGGTDPGRFCPTYMIFCESFIPPSKRYDPDFDRRDVYIITQNALADNTYLNYIRAHYNRSTEHDLPFFQEMLRGNAEKAGNTYTNLVARAVAPLDNFVTRFGWNVEQRRRREGVYPPKEIHTPSPEQSSNCFQSYINDAERRMNLNQLEAGEDVKIVDNRVQVSGQVSVMMINGLLTKIIFDENPDHEFYVEESYPLKWMYPYLTPFGIIMKINRQRVPEITEDIVKRDHDFWCLYATRLAGNWITYDTTVKQICDFAERTYLRMDYTGFKGSRKFVRDDDAQKAFSKLRSAIGGLYAWRVNNTTNPVEQQRVIKEAEFAFKQSFAFCPFSPEAVYRYVNLLVSEQRVDDALLIAETCLKFDPENAGVNDLVSKLNAIKQGQPVVTQAQPASLAQLEVQYQTNPGNVEVGFELARSYFQAQRTPDAYRVLEQIIKMVEPKFQASPSNAQYAFTLARAYGERQQHTEAVGAMNRLISSLEPLYQASPTNTSVGFYLAQAYLQLQKNTQALAILDRLIASPTADANILIAAAQLYAQANNAAKMEMCLDRLVKLMPDSPEAWYDLATVQVAQRKDNQALQSLSRSVELSRKRAAKQPGARDLAATISQDDKFKALWQMPEFKKLVSGK